MQFSGADKMQFNANFGWVDVLLYSQRNVFKCIELRFIKILQFKFRNIYFFM